MAQTSHRVNAAAVNAFLLLFLLFTAATNAKTKDLPPPNPSAGRTEVPVRLVRGYLVVVEGSLDGLEHQNLIVDTGTDPSIVNADIIHALGLPIRTATLAVANVSIQTGSARLPNLQVGPVHSESLPVLVQDLSALEHQLGIPIGAVIGLDVLGQTSFRIDYSAKRLVFGSVVPQEISLPLGDSSFATVDLLVGGRPAHLLVDTGAAGLVFFESRAGKRLGLQNLTAVRQDASLSGGFQTQVVHPGELLLGGHRFHVEKAFLAKGGENAGKTFDGLLGVGAMGFKSIAFDFEWHKIYLEI